MTREVRAVVRLQGGLGNQLFQWTLAKWLVQRGMEAVCDATSVPRFHDRVGVRALNLSNEPSLLGLQFHVGAPIHLRRVIHRLSTWRWRLRKFVIDDAWLGQNGLESLLEFEGPVYLEGYFQLDRIVDDVFAQWEASSEMRPKNPSNWFRAMQRQFQLEPRIGMHVRRGDFARSQGLLSVDYYANALDELRIDKSTPVAVYSDDPVSARKCLGSLNLENALFMEAPRESSAAETMSLMAAAPVLIASNSTLSWWAARLSKGRFVVPSDYGAPGLWQENRRLQIPGASVVASSWETDEAG